PADTASVSCSLEANLPTRLEVFGTQGQLVIDEFIRPPEIAVHRGVDRDVKPEILINEWPGGGYTYQAQEVMRCLRSGELSSPMVPWESTLGAMRTLDRWLAGVEVAQQQPGDRRAGRPEPAACSAGRPGPPSRTRGA